MRRVGRLRSGHSSLLRTSALTSSEADYSSSSEQSCDTVIYLGGGDTEDEGFGGAVRTRPAALPVAGRSPRAARRPLGWPRAAVKNAVETLSTQKEQWVDGPRAERLPGSKETWIDGPEPVMVDKETQADDPGQGSGSSTTTSSQPSTLDRSSGGPGLSDITERTEESGGPAGAEEEAGAALEGIEPPPLAASSAMTSSLTSASAQSALAIAMTSSGVGQSAPALAMTSSGVGQSAPAYVKFSREAAPASGGQADALVARVKPFVRDWVAKHSLGPSVGSADSTQTSPAHSMARTAGAADDANSMDTSGQFSVQSAPFRCEKSTLRCADALLCTQMHFGVAQMHF